MPVDNSEQFKAFIHAIMTGDSASFYLLAHEVADLNAAFVDQNGQHLTPINEAIRMGNQRMVDYLLDENIKLEYQDHLGRTPLLWASCRNQLSMLKQFVELGADIYKTDFKQNNALHLAIKENKTEMALELLTHGFNLNDQNNDGDTVVQLCIAKGNIRLLKEILNYQPDLTIKDMLDVSPLYNAIQLNKIECLKLLVINGADIHERHVEIETGLFKNLNPLEFCKQNKDTINPEITAYIESLYETERLSALITPSDNMTTLGF